MKSDLVHVTETPNPGFLEITRPFSIRGHSDAFTWGSAVGGPVKIGMTSRHSFRIEPLWFESEREVNLALIQTILTAGLDSETAFYTPNWEDLLVLLDTTFHCNGMRGLNRILIHPDDVADLKSSRAWARYDPILTILESTLAPIGWVIGLPEPKETGELVWSRTAARDTVYASFVVWGGDHLVLGTPSIPPPVAPAPPLTLWERLLLP